MARSIARYLGDDIAWEIDTMDDWELADLAALILQLIPARLEADDSHIRKELKTALESVEEVGAMLERDEDD